MKKILLDIDGTLLSINGEWHPMTDYLFENYDVVVYSANGSHGRMLSEKWNVPFCNKMLVDHNDLRTWPPVANVLIDDHAGPIVRGSNYHVSVDQFYTTVTEFLDNER